MATRYEYDSKRNNTNDVWIFVLLIIGLALLFLLFMYPALSRNNGFNVNVETPVGTQNPTSIPSPTVSVEPEATRSSSPTVLPTQ